MKGTQLGSPLCTLSQAWARPAQSGWGMVTHPARLSQDALPGFLCRVLCVNMEAWGRGGLGSVQTSLLILICPPQFV